MAHVEEKKSLRNPSDNPCWRGYKPVGTKKKGNREVPNCVPIKELHTADHHGPDEFHQTRADHEESYETDQYCAACLAEYLIQHENLLQEAKYRGRKVTLGKPFLTPGGPKKRAVYVKNPKGNVVKVNFGDPNLRIKKSNPKRRKAFRARHKCDTAKDRTTPRYWSCKFW